METSICYLHGDFLPLSEARVSVLDRGFIFGDAIYEVIPVFNGHPLRLGEHFDRLAGSLKSVYMDNPLERAAWTALCERLVADNGAGDQTLYIQVTRGVAPRDHVLSTKVPQTVFAMSSPLRVPDEVPPIEVVTAADERWQRCDIKTTSLIANVIARESAARRGAREAILIRDGWVTEGAASNVFVAFGGCIRTPPLSPLILPGVTRNLVVELDPDVREEAITETELRAADEVWVTSSGRELVPVTRIDGVAVGTGEVGPLFRQTRARYLAYKSRQ